MLGLFAFFINFPLAVVAGSWLLLARPVPDILCPICFFVALPNILARFTAWFGNGAALRGFAIAIQESGALVGISKMLAIELLIWGASATNIYVSLSNS